MTKLAHIAICAVLAAILVQVFTVTQVAAYIPRVQDVVQTGAIKTWSSGETLTSSDLNANFAHIHSTMVGGHGGRLVNADVNASAAISSSKLANGLGIAKSFVFIADACGATPCTMINAFNVTGVTRTSAGVYVATMPYTVGGSTISVTTVSATNDLYCSAAYLVGSTVAVKCRTVGGVATDSGFTLIAFNTTP